MIGYGDTIKQKKKDLGLGWQIMGSMWGKIMEDVGYFGKVCL